MAYKFCIAELKEQDHVIATSHAAMENGETINFQELLLTQFVLRFIGTSHMLTKIIVMILYGFMEKMVLGDKSRVLAYQFIRYRL
jgi:hypothetical protein